MSKTESFVCSDCGTAFGSKWARTDHEKHCPVKRSAELRRVHEQLTVHELEGLSEGVTQAHKAHFPRLSKLRSNVALLLEQAQELTTLLTTLNRDYGVRT